ncbi:MAG: hypothetical protein CEN88_263 [Candidatus Berkelbacteria bacterium Licking1014_2]|uniref:Uncharacterized protein n=1 Tax=Candidatus Berkelbacteria bacterium Licking1014_2 TaxID=2017146 RepID=A0A554LVA9_9BACT|nr:MAG: hypothetical protein CEN88_263 [Candidatus Berkelbacteria bacterium Licking1014_2]
MNILAITAVAIIWLLTQAYLFDKYAIVEYWGIKRSWERMILSFWGVFLRLLLAPFYLIVLELDGCFEQCLNRILREGREKR